MQREDPTTKPLFGILLLVAIHSGGLILTALLNNFYAIIIPYEYLPWSRLPVVIVEIVVFVYCLAQLKRYPIWATDRKIIQRLLLISVALFAGSQFRGFLDDSGPMFCGLALIDGSYESIYERHELQQFRVHIVETFMLAMALLLVGIRYLKRLP